MIAASGHPATRFTQALILVAGVPAAFVVAGVLAAIVIVVRDRHAIASLMRKG